MTFGAGAGGCSIGWAAVPVLGRPLRVGRVLPDRDGRDRAALLMALLWVLRCFMRTVGQFKPPTTGERWVAVKKEGLKAVFRVGPETQTIRPTACTCKLTLMEFGGTRAWWQSFEPTTRCTSAATWPVERIAACTSRSTGWSRPSTLNASSTPRLTQELV